MTPTLATDPRTPPAGRADALARALDGAGDPAFAVHLVPPGAGLPADTAGERAGTAGSGQPVLPVRTELGSITFGPLTVAGEPGCDTCFQRRQEAARAVGPEGERKLWETLSGSDNPPVPPLSAAALAAAAGLVALERDRSRQGEHPLTRGAVIELDAHTLAVRRRRFLPDPLCPVCGQVPDDGPEAGTLTLQSQPTSAAEPYRVRDLPAELDELLDTYVDDRCGVIASVTATEAGQLVLTTASGRSPGHPLTGDGFGRTTSYTSSAIVAVAEALERMGGLYPRARRTAVRASFAELGPDRALDPVVLGLPGHGTPGAPATPGGVVSHYTPDLALDWVHAHSFQRGGPLLVPVDFAYYGEHAPRLAFECSSGSALGGCLEEAVLHGLFEVIERDAFLVTWYARLSRTRVDPRSSTDRTNRLLVEQMERDSGCRVYTFDTTMPEGVPALTLALVDEQDRGDVPKAQFSAGAHLDPERALRGGLLELASTYAPLADHMRDHPEEPQRLADDPELVTEMEHHVTRYCSGASWPQLEFLFQDTETRTMTEAFPPSARYVPAGDLRTDLHRLVRRYLDGGLDVLVVDQTTSEHRAADLHCVKVLVPGTLSMTFGHQNRRTDGLPRLRTAPMRLGYRSTPLPEEDINPYPHPFP